MKRIQTVVNKRGIFFREPDGTITQILPHFRGDFQIMQSHPSGKKSNLTTYSDSGTLPFVLMVKFLLLTRAKLPRIPKSAHETSDFSVDRFKRAARSATTSVFPERFGTHLKIGGGVEIATARFVKYGREPRLLFETNYTPTMSISIPLAQKLVEIMPKIAGEGTGPFRLAVSILEDAVRNKTFEPTKKSVIEMIPRQREFSFVKKNRKEQWKKVLMRPKKRKSARTS